MARGTATQKWICKKEPMVAKKGAEGCGYFRSLGVAVSPKMKRKQYRIRQGEAAENTPSGRHPMRRCRSIRASEKRPLDTHIPLSTQSKSAPMPSVDELEKEIEECAHALARMHPSATRAFARDRGNPLASRAR